MATSHPGQVSDDEQCRKGALPGDTAPFQPTKQLRLLTRVRRQFEVEDNWLPRRIRTKNLLVYHAARLAEGSVSQACGFPARRVAMYAQSSANRDVRCTHEGTRALYRE